MKKAPEQPIAKVLIVDDNALCLETIAEILRREGLGIATATDGRRALIVLESEKVDLILLDVKLPDISGLTVLKSVRRMPANQHLPVILLTDAADKETVRTAAMLGIDAYLLKAHFSVSELLARVWKSLSHGSEHGNATGGGQMAASGGPGSDAQIAKSNTSGFDAAPARSAANKAVKATNRDLSRDAIIDRVRRSFELRSVPPVLEHVIDVTNNKESSISDVVEVVRHDQGLALKVMKMANSSFYNAGKRAHNLGEAAQRIGMAGIRNAVVAVRAIEDFPGATDGGLIPRHFWEHSLATAMLAQSLGEAMGSEHGDELFLAGLLHDIGRMTLSTLYPEIYRGVMETAAARIVDLADVEQEVFGLTHAEITREVLLYLRVPNLVTQLASAHTNNLNQMPRTGELAREIITLCQADRTARALLLGDSGNGIIHPLSGVRRLLHCPDEIFAEIAASTVDRCAELKMFYDAQRSGETRPSLVEELRQAAGTSHRLCVFADGTPNDAISFMLGQLGWLTDDRPEIAVVVGSNREEMQRFLQQMREWEQEHTPARSVLLIEPPGEDTTPEFAEDGRLTARLPLPIRHFTLIAALRDMKANLQSRGAAVQSADHAVTDHS